MTSVSLGMPSAPPPVLAPRRKTRQIKVGSVGVGSDSPISVQSMTTTPKTDINATLQQIAELTASGCNIVRVACPSADDAEALPIIAKKSQIPVIADIHFQPKDVFAAIEAGWQGFPEPLRTSIPVNATVPAVTADRVQEILARFGRVDAVKIKVAEPGQSLDDDAARVAAVREALPDAAIRVDANGGWDVPSAVEALTRLAGVGLEYAEQPVPDIAGLAEVRRRLRAAAIPVLIAAD
ncbi:flavodoxin-dependent (E)-4-hydroxy-3-methylbut-2-enyl-diphosphate synthase, partial [Microbacterium sp. Bi128]|uniref:flavodoxin-dependent (E)-4-hydroxy-3-methylbut-2-enyl-diphosphate synthase n=1 Tax=Microbacterium sp. Bi128 TaxID=2821115 RepID=UPI001E5A7732